MESKRLIEKSMKRDEIESRVIKGEKVLCPECGELLYFVRDWSKDIHPGVYCPNGHFKTMMTIEMLDMVGKEMWGQVGRPLKFVYSPAYVKALSGKDAECGTYSAETFNRIYEQNVTLPVEISEDVEEGTYEIYCTEGIEVHKISE